MFWNIVYTVSMPAIIKCCRVVWFDLSMKMNEWMNEWKHVLIVTHFFQVSRSHRQITHCVQTPSPLHRDVLIGFSLFVLLSIYLRMCRILEMKPQWCHPHSFLVWLSCSARPCAWCRIPPPAFLPSVLLRKVLVCIWARLEVQTHKFYTAENYIVSAGRAIRPRDTLLSSNVHVFYNGPHLCSCVMCTTSTHYSSYIKHHGGAPIISYIIKDAC